MRERGYTQNRPIGVRRSHKYKFANKRIFRTNAEYLKSRANAPQNILEKTKRHRRTFT